MIKLWIQSTVKWFTGIRLSVDDAIAQICDGNNELLSTFSKIISKYLKFTIGWHYWCINVQPSTKHKPTSLGFKNIKPKILFNHWPSNYLLFLYAIHNPKFCIFLYQDFVKWKRNSKILTIPISNFRNATWIDFSKSHTITFVRFNIRATFWHS